MLLTISAIGIYGRQKCARIIVLGIHYLIGLGFAAIGLFLAKNTFERDYTHYERTELYLPFILLIFAYVILVGLITFVSSSKLKEEFDREN